MAMIGRIARLVLLACTLFGLAAMHTIEIADSHGAGAEFGRQTSEIADELPGIMQDAGIGG